MQAENRNRYTNPKSACVQETFLKITHYRQAMKLWAEQLLSSSAAASPSPSTSRTKCNPLLRENDAWNTRLVKQYPPAGKMPKWPGQPTWHQIFSLYHLLSTDFDFTKSSPVQHLLKQQKPLLLIHTFLDRRLMNAELPWTEREVNGSSPKLWRQKSNNKPWLGNKRENNANPQGSWHRSTKVLSQWQGCWPGTCQCLTYSQVTSQSWTDHWRI